MRRIANVLLISCLLFTCSAVNCLTAENDESIDESGEEEVSVLGEEEGVSDDEFLEDEGEEENTPGPFFREEQENRLPVVTGIEFDTVPIRTGQDIKANVAVVDADGDAVSLDYAWTVNGQQINDITDEVLPAGFFKKGDQILLEVTPSDDDGEGDAYPSAVVPVVNALPAIVSSPEGNFEEGTYTYQVQVEDPDEDAIEYEIEEGPQGLSINRDTGLITWAPADNQTGLFKVVVLANDSDGGFAKQEFTLEVGPGLGQPVQ